MKPPKPKTVHRGKLIRSDGAVVALCVAVTGSRRVVDLSRESWTHRDWAVNCKKCLALMPASAAEPKKGGGRP